MGQEGLHHTTHDNVLTGGQSINFNEKMTIWKLTIDSWQILK